MATVNAYLNFPGNCEEAFNFYKSVFGGEFQGGIMRFRDVPPSDNVPPMPEDTKNMVMHVLRGSYRQIWRPLDVQLCRERNRSIKKH